ncbi:MAG TPA: HEAT repeat domain-containing protein [Myxococcota bacterium]|nr:HEAT repeat domain-containing protein [Myxococcota bacterium]
MTRGFGTPGYTPARRDFPELVLLLGEPSSAEEAERALRTAGLPAALFAAEALATSEPARAPALIRLAGRALRTHDSPELLQALARALRSTDPETRRQAAMALGKSGRGAAEPALLECLATADGKLLRSAIEALGKVGGERSLATLREITLAEKLQPIAARALLILERNAERAAGPASGIALDVRLPRPSRVVLSCRAGLAGLLAEEARSFGARRTSDSEVSLDWSGPLRPLLSLRIALRVGLERPLGEATADAVLRVLLEPELQDLVCAWTLGSPRFRLEWVGHGHRRTDTWKIAQGLREARARLQSDPVRAPWAIEVRDTPTPHLRLVPVGAPELRFAYRARDVPAASHPTIAAALARAGGVRADDVVWDPFVGSGLELVERARLGPFRELHGTDLETRALDAARENLTRAELAEVQLVQADARSHRVPGLTLVLTNPPMGRRAHRARGLSSVLCAVVRNVAGQLAAGGRMVWLSPFPEATARAAAAAGLQVERLENVDLGGFGAELQRFTRSRAGSSRGRGSRPRR